MIKEGVLVSVACMVLVVLLVLLLAFAALVVSVPGEV